MVPILEDFHRGGKSARFWKKFKSSSFKVPDQGELENPELTSSHGHTRTTGTNETTISENDLKIAEQIFYSGTYTEKARSRWVGGAEKWSS